jgi:hypothetical protein
MCEWKGVVFELVFVIMLYVIDSAILMMYLDDSLYFNNVGHFTLWSFIII